MSKYNGGAAFPIHSAYENENGLTIRDYFAIHGPEPRDSDVEAEARSDRVRNPHNDGPPKPPIRCESEIRAALRYRYADAMLAERDK